MWLLAASTHSLYVNFKDPKICGFPPKFTAEAQNRIEINQKSDSVSAPLKLMSSRMSPRASHRRCATVDQHQPVVVMKIDLFTWSGFSWIFSWPPNWDFKSIFITSEITSRLAFQLDWVEINQLRENTWREMNRNGSIRSDWNSIQSHVNSSYKALW